MQYKKYSDHIGLWKQELKSWIPDTVFDAHVHLGLPDVIGKINDERLKEPLLTYKSLSWQEVQDFYDKLYSGKTIAGMIVFPFPFRETDIEAANQYIIDLMKKTSLIKGFLLSDPFDIKRTVKIFDTAIKQDIRFYGVKPYYDLLGKSNFKTTMPEFISDKLLDFMNSEKLIMMLHTSGIGMGDKNNQAFVKSITDKFQNIKIILAHMGRYINLEQFDAFIESDVIKHHNIFLEMSSATKKEVYDKVLARKCLHSKLLFGSDLPYGLITGIEHWSDELGAVFITRDDYAWSDKLLNKRFADLRYTLTYNTYHVIKALKDAMNSAQLNSDEITLLKNKIFLKNASELLS